MAPTVPIDFVGQKQLKKCLIPQMIGKSRKYYKGHSSGFVPDYRHAVETMAESEGIGSSGKVDTEMTASEDSCAPKMKCISLNMDGYDSFGVPLQVLTLSKMSRTERRSLELKLKTELEQVRVLLKKVASLSYNVVPSPSSDIWSYNDGKKRPLLESIHGPSDVLAPKGKKRAPPGLSRPQTKKVKSGRFELEKPAASTSNAMLMKQCENLLNRLMSHQFGWVFNTPVDEVKLNIPDYFTVIKHPMDLGTIKSKIISGQYSSPLGFANDVRLTFSNAMTYNPPGNDVNIMAGTLRKLFDTGWKAIEKKLPVTVDMTSMPPRAPVITETETIKGMPPTKKKIFSLRDNTVKSEPVRRVMTSEEKHILSTELEALLEELPESIIEFLKEHSVGETGEDELEIDIDALSDDTLFALRKLLDDYVLDKPQKLAKPGACETEILNESGLSNPSMQLCKGNDLVDEDVDIVSGNCPPVTDIPPIEIEEDAAHRNSKDISSSSSTSESGSSSSDSGSSSGSECDAAKASVPANASKENLGSGANLDERKSTVVPDIGNCDLGSGANLDERKSAAVPDIGNCELGSRENLDERKSAGAPDIGNSSVNGLDQVELNSKGKPTAIEVDSNQEGESAPSKRQVSPDKLYRAALLRNRFADTILKAQEKSLEKGEKLDPEKLRIEREELERRHREEKVRLQAEAKAAEEARRKAEAEAAAEAKRQRELERVAARQALQKMEKTVDINENSRFMEDFEMLRTAQDEQLPSFSEEASPEHLENRLGSFKFQGSSNPLEQLGLYMKMDDDDEEEVELPQTVKEPVKEVEDGEIN